MTGRRQSTSPLARRLRIYSSLAALAWVGASASTAPAAAQAPPPPRPTGLWAAQTSPTELTVRWDSVPGATGYRLYQKVGDAGTESDYRLHGEAARNRFHWIILIKEAAFGTPQQYLLASVGGGGAASERVPFNSVVPIAASSAPGQAPAPGMLTASLTDSAEVTVSWEEVPGATGYLIGRAVTPYGFASLCALCPTATTFVDRRVTRGAGHSYTVEAVTAAGVSRRAVSNTVPVPPRPEASPDVLSTFNGVLQRLLNPASQTGPAAPRPPAPPLVATATASPPGQVRVSWQANTVDSVSAFVLERSVNLGTFSELAEVSGEAREYADVALPSVFENGRMKLKYRVRARNAHGTSLAAETAPALIENAAAPSTPGFCHVEYRRADNMWANRSAPSVAPGTETLRLESGTGKRFDTDWKHEKKRNDGTTYYGSHLRVLRNTGPRAVTLYLRSVDPVVEFMRGSNLESLVLRARQMAVTLLGHNLATHSVTVPAGEPVGLRADLVEVACPAM